MATGTGKFYNSQRGFGLIRADGLLAGGLLALLVPNALSHFGKVR
jgi:hypothetical protein